MTDNPRISGIDWQGLQKGDLVPHHQVKEFFYSLYPDKEWDDFSMVKVIENELTNAKAELAALETERRNKKGRKRYV